MHKTHTHTKLVCFDIRLEILVVYRVGPAALKGGGGGGNFLLRLGVGQWVIQHVYNFVLLDSQTQIFS